MPRWYNPSMNSRHYDKRNNVTIEPGKFVDREPDADLIKTGKIIKVDDDKSQPKIQESNEPLRVSSLILAGPGTDHAISLSGEELTVQMAPAVTTEEAPRKGRGRPRKT